MSTSFTATYADPASVGRNQPVVVSRGACFGTFNRHSQSHRETLEVMEFHPESANNGRKSAKECLAFINCLSPWKNVFRLTSIGSIAADIRNHPADKIITGFMAMRNYNYGYYTGLSPSATRNQTETDARFFIADAIGAGIGTFGFNWGNDRGASDEGSMCNLRSEDDAYGLYLLAFGTEEECQSMFVQNPLFSDGPNTYGYLRGSSDLFDTLRRTLPVNQRSVYNQMSNWLRAYLRSDAAAASGKLGRLTVQQFKDRHVSRGSSAETYFDMLEELKDLYS